MILKRGDHIHLAIPLGRNPEERGEACRKLAALYNQMGVFVPVLSEHEGMKEPKVIAVFRDDE